MDKTMIILGLTGSIGMGKTVAANTFRRFGIPVHDADQTVHDLMAPGGKAFAKIAEGFPDVIENSTINRKRLGDQVFADTEALKRLESILHPLVGENKNKFLSLSARRRCSQVVLDVPLLFETDGQKKCDAVITVSAPSFVQRARVLARPGMTEQKFASILAKQVPDREKCRKSDFVVQTGNGRLESLSAIRKIITETGSLRAANWPPASPRTVSRRP
jgi:dephospho-CoA kinase